MSICSLSDSYLYPLSSLSCLTFILASAHKPTQVAPPAPGLRISQDSSSSSSSSSNSYSNNNDNDSSSNSYSNSHGNSRK